MHGCLRCTWWIRGYVHCVTVQKNLCYIYFWNVESHQHYGSGAVMVHWSNKLTLPLSQNYILWYELVLAPLTIQ